MTSSQYQQLTTAGQRSILAARVLELETAHFTAALRRAEAEHDEAAGPDVVEAATRDIHSLTARLQVLDDLTRALPDDDQEGPR